MANASEFPAVELWALEPVTDGSVEKGQRRRRVGGIKITALVLAAFASALVGYLIHSATTAADSADTLPVEVEQLLSDFAAAVENNDYFALQALVADAFRRPEYGIHPDGATGEYRQERDLGYFEREFGYNNPIEWSISTTGAPVVRGDGPWIVSVPQDWEQVGTGTKYEAVYTFAIVDRDGTLQINDGYWARIGPTLAD